MEVPRFSCAKKWQCQEGGTQQPQERWSNMKWKIGRLIRKSETEIRGAGCKEIVTNERQLCAPLCLHLDLVASNHESSFCDVTAILTLGGALEPKLGVYSNTQGAASVSLPPVQRRGQRPPLPLAFGNGSGTVGLFGSFPPAEITEAQRLYSM